MSRTITRYNICIKTKRRVKSTQRNAWVLVSVVLVQYHHKLGYLSYKSKTQQLTT